MIERYSLPEINAVFSEQNKYETWLRVELAYTESLVSSGIAPLSCLNAILEKARINPKRIQEIEVRTNHDLIAFLESLSETVGDYARFIHLGLTSSDIVDTAQMLIMLQALSLIEKKILRLTDLLRELALKYKKLPEIGRTHGIHAEPLTLGVKFLLFHCEFKRHLERLAETRNRLSVGKLSGAVGTYSQNTPELEKNALASLGLSPCPVTTQVIQRDRIADYFYLLSVIGASLEKIATEIRHLQRTEVRELEEPFGKGQKGSSAMPHKRNPIICERICGISRLLRSYLIPSLENIPLWHERDISHSSVERVTIPDASILAYYALEKMTGVISGLTVNESQIERNLHLLGDAFFSQRILLHLVEKKGMARDKAYVMLQEVTHCLYQGGMDIRKALAEHKDLRAVLSQEEISDLTDISHFFRNLDAIYERALK
ncbi:MAG: adenylosuccinate lyase [Candidatus Wallbacteria bacterium]|nr:adenylosuccinate lyase [Candidatus Wallbacteria bacterium]